MSDIDKWKLWINSGELPAAVPLSYANRNTLLQGNNLSKPALITNDYSLLYTNRQQ